METCEQFPQYEHPHHDACPGCGDTHRVTEGIPGRAMGGMWIEGTTLERCRGCNKILAYR